MGGSGTAAGMGFQHRVGAWLCTRILADSNAAPPWSLPGTATLELIRCEQNLPIDDLLVGTAVDGYVYLQSKRSLTLSAEPASEFFSVIDQFVRQFLACRDANVNGRSWARPTDPLRDRFVLVLGPTASGAIRTHLTAALGQLRGLIASQQLMDAANNDDERRALTHCVDHAKAAWRAVIGADPTDTDIRDLLRLVHVQTLDVEHDGAAELEAKTLLRGCVLARPDTADAAWASLISLCQDLATTRSGRDRSQLQARLTDAGIEVLPARSYRGDIDRLKAYSLRTAQLLSDLSRIRVGATEVKIRRPAIVELARTAEGTSLLVVGEPGAGKSGGLYTLAEEWRMAARDIVFLAVDRLGADSLDGLRDELRLDHDFDDVLAHWPGGRPAFLVIDALDSARGSPAAQALQDLIHLVTAKAGRWRVISSIRKFDLRYSPALQDEFAGTPSPAFADPEFRGVRHINVPVLADPELAEAERQAPQLRDLLARASPELRTLLRVPFNMRLASELLGTGLTAGELSPIRSQLELLERYWSRRVIRDDGRGDLREIILCRAANAMVAVRRLRAERREVVEAQTAEALEDVLSHQVLIEWQATPETPADRAFLAFPHNILFDYAVARLVLPENHDALLARLTAEPELILAARPSLSIYFQRLWARDRARFWHAAFALVDAPGLPEVGKLIAPTVAAEMAAEPTDLQPLFEGLAARSESADQVLKHIVGALLPGAL